MLTYPQWFALLTLNSFASYRPDRVVRYQTLRLLVRRGYAVERYDHSFRITASGIATYNSIERAPS